jgi:endogenous inhibitor of DNA gyrase (YacG/DUF329 family)
MKTQYLASIAVALVSLLAAPLPNARAAEKSVDRPAHQVIACYFHRTERCPTCQKISAYIEESVYAGFASELKDKTVRMAMVDFQDAKNKKYAEAYGIDGPTLVVMNVRNGKVVDWKAAPKVWSLVGEKEKFVDYVQSEVRSYLEEKTAGSQ